MVKNNTQAQLSIKVKDAAVGKETDFQSRTPAASPCFYTLLHHHNPLDTKYIIYQQNSLLTHETTLKLTVF